MINPLLNAPVDDQSPPVSNGIAGNQSPPVSNVNRLTNAPGPTSPLLGQSANVAPVSNVAAPGPLLSADQNAPPPVSNGVAPPVVGSPLLNAPPPVSNVAQGDVASVSNGVQPGDTSSKPQWLSPVQNAVAGAPMDTMSGAGWLNHIRGSRGVSPGEVSALGLDNLHMHGDLHRDKLNGMIDSTRSNLTGGQYPMFSNGKMFVPHWGNPFEEAKQHPLGQ